MNLKLRILTYHHIPNNGAFLFSYSLANILRGAFPLCDVKFIDYKTLRLVIYEYLKFMKFFRREPFFYYKRNKLWKNFLQSHLDLDQQYPHWSGERGVQHFYGRNCNALLVGMDVWCINRGTQRPGFPNIYWLPEKMDIPKVAYGVSAYYSNATLIHENAGKITGYLNAFDVIGCRDRFTHEMVMRYRTRANGLVMRIPDPTLFVELPSTEMKATIEFLGINPNRPILGLLLHKNDDFTRGICAHFRNRGYQVIALSMYNPFADINLGHTLNPLQWAEFFKLLSFCVTDRFHGTIFCIKNRIPFLSVETEPLPRAQSKLHDLLLDNNLTTCYEDPNVHGHSIQTVISHIREIENTWENSLEPLITPAKRQAEVTQKEFIRGLSYHLGL